MGRKRLALLISAFILCMAIRPAAVRAADPDLPPDFGFLGAAECAAAAAMNEAADALFASLPAPLPQAVTETAGAAALQAEARAVQPRTDFTSWQSVRADYPHLEIREIPVSAGDMHNVTWEDILTYVISETGCAVIAYDAGGTFIPPAAYAWTYVRPGQHLAVVDGSNRVLALAVLTGSGPDTGDTFTWNQITAAYPYLTVTAFPVPSNLNGRVSWQVLSQTLYDRLDGEAAVVPFDLSGNPIPAGAADAMMHAGEHFAVFTAYGDCLALGVITLGDPVRVPDSALQNLKWRDIRRQYPQLPVREIRMEINGDEIIWLTLMLKVSASHPDAALIPFYTDGSLVNPLDYGCTYMQHGQHVVGYDSGKGKVTALGVIVGRGQSAPPEPDIPLASAGEEYPSPAESLYLTQSPQAGLLVRGLTAGQSPVCAADLEKMFTVPSGASLKTESARQTPLTPAAAVGTGVRILLRAAGGSEKACTLVMNGDVLGSGMMSISQLVRMAKALTGAEPLTGVYLLAADLNNSGALDIGDLAAESKLLTGA